MSGEINAHADGVVRTRAYDVLVVGGGVAGVAIAERIARESARRGQRLSIRLVERQPKLGGGSSGGLEGWYHSGALYTRQNDLSTYKACMDAVQHLHNWYAKDPLFLENAHCRVELRKTNSVNDHLVPRLEPGGAHGDSWFEDSPIGYVLQRMAEPDVPRITATGWEQLRERTIDLLVATYHNANWKLPNGLCRAPELPEFVYSVLRAAHARSHGAVRKQIEGSKGVADMSAELGPYLDSYRNRFGLPQTAKDFDFIPTADVVMNTHAILTDLAASAVGRGVEVTPGWSLESVHTPRYGQHPNVTGVILSDGRRREHIVAKQYVFAMGGGFDDILLRQTLNLRLRVRHTKSVMLTIWPRLADRSFVRMGADMRHYVNHVVRSFKKADGTVDTYSMFADSNRFESDAAPADLATAAERLIKRAQAYFEKGMAEAKHVHWYPCYKAEFIDTDTGKDRNYNYWFEPLWGPDWGTAERTEERRVDEERIRAAPPEQLAASLDIKKRLHLEHLQLLADGADRQTTYGTIETLREQYAERCTERPNFVCVLPGKFTFFSTLALRVHLEMVVRGLYSEAGPSPLAGDVSDRAAAADLVYRPKPVRELAR